MNDVILFSPEISEDERGDVSSDCRGDVGSWWALLETEKDSVTSDDSIRLGGRLRRERGREREREREREKERERERKEGRFGESFTSILLLSLTIKSCVDILSLKQKDNVHV